VSTTRKISPIEHAETAPERSGGWVAIPASSDTEVRVGFASLEERNRVLKWLDAGLRDARPGRLASEYPLLFDRNASVRHFTLWERETPLAFCTLWAVTYRVGVHRLRAGMISLVYTDPIARGCGHASRIVEAAMRHAGELELGVVLLWSELDALYEPLGFHRSGHESMVVIDCATLQRAIEAESPAPDLRVAPATPADWPDIERLRGFRTCQLELDPGEIGRARTIPDLDVRVARDASGLQGFAMRGRGDDLGQVVHEWGGQSSAALLCCEALLSAAQPGSELFLMTPPANDDLSWSLRAAGARRLTQPLAWMRIASPRALAADLRNMEPSLDGLSIEFASDLGGADRPMRLSTKRGEVVVEHAALLDTLFGGDTRPDPRMRLRPLFPEREDGLLTRLPLPFFVWGLESI